MNEDLAERVTEAIAEWLAVNGGGFGTAFSLCAELIDGDGDRAWATAHHDNQTPSHTLGLLRWHTMNAEQQCVEMMFHEDEDDQ